MKSIKEHLSKINDTVDKWGNIPMAHDRQDDLEALEVRNDAWWNNLRAEIKELEKALFGETVNL